jgi:hypothetical protein
LFIGTFVLTVIFQNDCFEHLLPQRKALDPNSGWDALLRVLADEGKERLLIAMRRLTSLTGRWRVHASHYASPGGPNQVNAPTSTAHDNQ